MDLLGQLVTDFSKYKDDAFKYLSLLAPTVFTVPDVTKSEFADKINTLAKNWKAEVLQEQERTLLESLAKNWPVDNETLVMLKTSIRAEFSFATLMVQHSTLKADGLNLVDAVGKSIEISPNTETTYRALQQLIDVDWSFAARFCQEHVSEINELLISLQPNNESTRAAVFSQLKWEKPIFSLFHLLGYVLVGQFTAQEYLRFRGYLKLINSEFPQELDNNKATEIIKSMTADQKDILLAEQKNSVTSKLEQCPPPDRDEFVEFTKKCGDSLAAEMTILNHIKPDKEADLTACVELIFEHQDTIDDIKTYVPQLSAFGVFFISAYFDKHKNIINAF
jgi:hypothetical protein